jgi:hypothetical protein
MPSDAAIGGRSAAAWWGAPFASATDPVLVVAPKGSSWDGPTGVRVHKTALGPGEVLTGDHDVRITTARRTAWEIATLEPLMTAVALLDGMLRVGTHLVLQPHLESAFAGCVVAASGAGLVSASPV